MNREEALDVALGQIERQFGKGVGHEDERPGPGRGSARSRPGRSSLDLALGIGGLPRGRVVEVFGPESSGKTTLVYHVIAEAQRRGGICAFIDAEHAMDPQYAQQDRRQHRRPARLPARHGRAGARDHRAARSAPARSTSSRSTRSPRSTPKAEIEGEMGDTHVGLQARLMSQALRKLAGTLNRTDTICLFTNQLREKIGVMFGSPETTPGGRALKFYASVRLDIRRIETLKDGAEADRQPRPRQGGQEQGRAAVQAGRVRHHLRPGHLLGGHGPRRRARAEDRAEVGLVLQLRRRAARPGPPERDRVPAASTRTSSQQILQQIQAQAGPDQVVSARLLPSVAGRRARSDARRRRGRGRRARSRRSEKPPPPRRSWRSADAVGRDP